MSWYPVVGCQTMKHCVNAAGCYYSNVTLCWHRGAAKFVAVKSDETA